MPSACDSLQRHLVNSNDLIGLYNKQNGWLANVTADGFSVGGYE